MGGGEVFHLYKGKDLDRGRVHVILLRMSQGKYVLRKKEERIPEMDITYGTLIADLLISRGIKSLDAAKKHLHSRLEDLHGNPFDIPPMAKAIERIEKAISNNEKIAIHADYDCDGIPGAVILSSLFNKIGYTNYIVSIPDRNLEGYGLGISHIEKVKQEEVSLIVTIDLGITADEAVTKASNLGMEVIITDHHTIPAVIPNAYAIVHPKIMGSTYSNPELCGAGVVYTLVRAFIEMFGNNYGLTNNFILEVVDMAAFATLSDMVELTTENKALIKEGMEKIRNNPRPGILALARAARVYLKAMTQDDITFMLAPKLNVASRMGNPYDAYYLLMETDVKKAEERALKLTALSNERRKLVAIMVKEARREIAKLGKEEKEVILVGHPSWKVGLLGLVASKISEIYNKPTLAWGRTDPLEGNPEYKGSCRGNGTINMYELMNNLENGVLSEFGGHYEAGGFSINQESIYTLEEKLTEAYKKTTAPENSIKDSLKLIDACLPISLLHPKLHSAISKLGPFGPGNEEPVFAFKNATIVDIRNFGTGNAHIEITFRDLSGQTASTYAFYTSLNDLNQVKIGDIVHIIGSLDLKLWQEKVRLRLKDIIIPKNV